MFKWSITHFGPYSSMSPIYLITNIQQSIAAHPSIVPEVRWNDGRSWRHLFGLLQTEGHEGDQHESSMKATEATVWKDLKTLVNAKTHPRMMGFCWLTDPAFSGIATSYLFHLLSAYITEKNGDQWKIHTKGVNQFEFWPPLLLVWHWELGDEVWPLYEFGLLQLDELSSQTKTLQCSGVELNSLSQNPWKLQLLQHSLDCLITHFWFTNTYCSSIYIYFIILLFSSIGQECMSQLFDLAKAATLCSDPTDQVQKSKIFSASIIDDHPDEKNTIIEIIIFNLIKNDIMIFDITKAYHNNQLCASCLSWWNLDTAVRWIIASSQFTFWVAAVSSFTQSPAQSHHFSWTSKAGRSRMDNRHSSDHLVLGNCGDRQRELTTRRKLFSPEQLVVRAFDVWPGVNVVVGSCGSACLWRIKESPASSLVCSLIFNIVSALHIWDALHWLA